MSFELHAGTFVGMCPGLENGFIAGNCLIVEGPRMSKYFRIVGVSGAVKLSTLFGSKILYAENICLLSFLTSGLASLVVPRMIASMALALVSFSKSGGLQQFKHARVPSAATSLKEEDLSLINCKKKWRKEGSWVAWIMDMIEERAWLMITLFVRHRE